MKGKIRHQGTQQKDKKENEEELRAQKKRNFPTKKGRVWGCQRFGSWMHRRGNEKGITQTTREASPTKEKR